MPLESNMTSGTNIDRALLGVSGKVEFMEIWDLVACDRHMDLRGYGATPEQVLLAMDEWNVRTDHYVPSRAQYGEHVDDVMQAVRTQHLAGRLGHGDYRRTLVRVDDYLRWSRETADSRNEMRSKADFRFLTHLQRSGYTSDGLEAIEMAKGLFQDYDPDDKSTGRSGYTTDGLEAIETAKGYWRDFDPNIKSTAPTKKEVVEKLKARGTPLSHNMLCAIDTLVRPANAPRGRRPKDRK